MSEQPAIILRYDLSQDEYVEACRANARKTPARWTLPVFSYAMIVLGLLLLFKPREFPKWTAPLLLIVFGIILVVAAGWWHSSSIEQAWRKVKDTLQTTTVRLERDGLHYETPLMQCRFAWTTFTKVVETRSLFLLYASDELQLMLPKRAATTLSELDETRRVLEHNISRVPGAFPVVTR